MEKKRANLVVSGWYGCGNAGDDAILEGILRTVRRLATPAEVAVLSYDPALTESTFGTRAHPHLPAGLPRFGQAALNGSLARTLRAFRRADLFLLGGGGFLSDWQSEAPWLWLRQLLLARALGKRTMLYAIGAGPFLTRRGRRLTRWLVDRCADYVTVRDERSKLCLLDIGCEREITVTGDPALEVEAREEEGVSTLKAMEILGLPLVGINAIPLFASREWGRRMGRFSALKEGLAEIVRGIVRHPDLHVLGIPFMETDRALLAAVAAGVGSERVHVMDHGATPGALLAVVGRLRAMIGMRYHSLLFSAMAATPFYAIVYHPKGSELVRATKMGRFSQEIGDGTQAADRDLDPAEVLDRIGYLLEHGEEVGRCLAARTQRLRAREGYNARVLRRAVDAIGGG